MLYNSVNGSGAPLHQIPQPRTWQRHQALTPTRFRLIPFRSPLLRESLLLSIPWATKMFQFAQFPLPVLFHSNRSDTPLQVPGFPIRTSTGQTLGRQLTVASRSRPTSFIGSTCQGIHRWLFVTWKSTKDARARYAILNRHNSPNKDKQNRPDSRAIRQK